MLGCKNTQSFGINIVNIYYVYQLLGIGVSTVCILP
jgi:hypothetical protein